MKYVKTYTEQDHELIHAGTSIYTFNDAKNPNIITTEKFNQETQEIETQEIDTGKFTQVSNTEMPAQEIDALGNAKIFALQGDAIIQLCDYRGQIAYNTSTKEAKTIDYLGDLEAGHTLEEPPEYSDWDDDNEAWLIDTISQTAARINEKKAQLRAGLAEHCRQLAYEKDFENMHSAIVYASYTHPDPLLTDAENTQLATTIDTAKKLAAYNSKFWSAVTTQHEALSDDELLALTVQQAIQQLPQYEH